MKKRIQSKILTRQIESEFNIQIIQPRRYRGTNKIQSLYQAKLAKRLLWEQIGEEFNVDIIPHTRGRGKNAGYIKPATRDDYGNHIRLDGELVLSHLQTDMGKTLSPSEQYHKSHLRKIALGIEHLYSNE